MPIPGDLDPPLRCTADFFSGCSQALPSRPYAPQPGVTLALAAAVASAGQKSFAALSAVAATPQIVPPSAILAREVLGDRSWLLAPRGMTEPAGIRDLMRQS